MNQLHRIQNELAMKWKGVFAVIGGFLIHLTLGTLYTFGNMNTYITSYMKKRVDHNIDYSQTIWVNAAAMFGQGSLMIVGGVLERFIGARWTCLIGSVIFSGSVALTVFSIDKSFIAVVFTYGLSSSFGLGIAYIAPLALGMKWFPNRKGLVNGIVVSGFGLGALIFNQVQTTYLNPKNLVPDKNGYFEDDEILDRVPTVFLLLGGIYFILQIIGVILLFSPQLEWNESYSNLLKSGNQETDNDDSSKEDLQLPAIDRSLKPSEIILKKEFYMLALTFALIIQCVQFINTMYKAYGQTFIDDDHFLSWVGSLASIFNSLGRIVWGQIQDKTSYRSCMLCLSGALSSLMLSLIATSYDGKAMFTIWILGIFFTFSGLFVLLPTVTAQLFGPKYAGTNYGLLFIAQAISSILGAFVIQILLSSLHWFGTFMLLATFAFSVGIITYFFPSKTDSYYS
ncbi:uncharacterized protein LOC111628560 [Centruroides sculpturatus]|uniref:uncharacterized protein LOC111628560 n=1 Tax=Centruroides sculpturatus TaxID=218467 RepID=UPI000C6E8360|nr:uncharacterized protein LOC111628560 [Centruroides sculpturatus]